MRGATVRDLSDRLIPGGLLALLRKARRHGDSFSEISDTLREKYNIRVDRETVRRWCSELGVTE